MAGLANYGTDTGRGTASGVSAPMGGARAVRGISLGECLSRAAAAHGAGRLDEAEAGYRSILAAQPGHADALQLMGVLAHQRGDSEAAIGLLEKALETDRTNASCHNNLGSIYFALGAHERAEPHFRKATLGKGASGEAWSNLGLVLRRKGDVEDALAAFHNARKLDPAYAQPLREIGGIWLERRDYARAEAAFRDYVGLCPDDMMAINNLAYAVQNQGRFAEAETLFQQGLEKAGGAPALGYNLRVLLTLQGRGEEARELFRRQLREHPDTWTAELGLALNLARRGLVEEAVRNFEDILNANPDRAAVWNDIGMVLVEMGKPESAIGVLERAVEIDPAMATAHNNLASAYALSHRPKEAIPAYRAAIAAKPDFIDPYVNLCRALREVGDYDQANLFGHAALGLDGYERKYFPNLLQVFRGTCDFKGLAALGDIWDNCEAQPVKSLPSLFLDLLVCARTDDELSRFASLVGRWARFMEAEAEAAPLPEEPEPDRGERIRVGFLSSDLRSHSVSRFLVPLMRGYDRARFEIFCYCPIRSMGDPVQELIKSEVDHFTFVEGQTEWEIARTIQKDGLDILFELNGFTQSSRVQALAYKPAPVQVSWLGYPFTCGLKAIDHVVMDRFVAPEAERFLVEEPVLMPDAWVCFGKFADVDIAPGLPMDREGRLTFGTLNNPYKYTPEMIANWARVMREVPDSRFLIVRPEARSLVLARNLADEFARHGIGSDRLYFFDNRTRRDNHLSYYNQIDVSLDTFPLTGGTTTCEATWMGVPVVSLAGRAFQQRISYTALMQCGLDELCTFDDDAFVTRAVEVAEDRAGLSRWRHGLRDAMRASPLCDHDRFVFQFQEMVEQVVRHHGLR